MIDPKDIDKRFMSRPEDDQENRVAYISVQAHCMRLAVFLNTNLPDGREKSTALTKLEEVMFWGIAGYARTQQKGSAS